MHTIDRNVGAGEKMEVVLRIDKVGGTFCHRPREDRRDVAYIEHRARKCGFYDED